MTATGGELDTDQLLVDVEEMLAAKGGKVVVLDHYWDRIFGTDPEAPQKGYVVIFVPANNKEGGGEVAG